jgi:hypothetical protein
MLKKIQIKNNIFLEIFGWYGTFAIVLAYILISFNLLKADSLPYQILNITGALGIVFSSLAKKNYQPVVLNLIWFITGLIAFIGLIVR